MKILIADDNIQNLYMLKVLLKGAGYDVVTAKNGIEALEKLHASQFDGIVSDILMPLMDGFRLIRECKKDPVLRQIPFIFYTATYTEKKDEEFGLSLGAIRYIIKPAEPEELLRQIQEAFIDTVRSPGDFTTQPIPDEVTFNREYTQRVGAKLEKKERALKESEEKYRLLYENSMDAILFTSPDGNIQAANPAACAMFQRTEEEIIKTGRAGVIDATDPRLSAALEERARTGRFEGELTFLRKDGARFPGEMSSSIFTDRTGQKRTSMIIRDITGRKRAEKALRIAKQKLQLMNMVAWHDIQNKITGIRGYIELSKDLVQDTQVIAFLQKEEEILKVIHQQLAYTKEYQEMGVQPPQWIQIRDALQNVRFNVSLKQIQLTVDIDDVEIFCDPVIKKVFVHLVENSISHGQTVNEIRVCYRETDDGVTIIYEE
ncbi:MAG: response regulator, partial [Methanoregula sp.]|nr:response regulator [Methanoregula sp.]